MRKETGKAKESLSNFTIMGLVHKIRELESTRFFIKDEKLPEMLDELYKAGYSDREKERSYDPRNSEVWEKLRDLFNHDISSLQFLDEEKSIDLNSGEGTFTITHLNNGGVKFEIFEQSIHSETIDASDALMLIEFLLERILLE